MNFKDVLLFIWQLPQNLIGFILSRNSEIRHFKLIDVYFVHDNKVANAGVSLGKYIVLGQHYLYYNSLALEKVYMHEFGHTRQSLYLGWLYLIIIGLPSALGNLWDRIFHKKWSTEKRLKWYYSQPWEKWADKLGNVKRNFEE